MITTLSLSTTLFLLDFQFDHNNLTDYFRESFFITAQHEPETETFILIAGLILEAIRYLKDLFVELFLISSIIPLWLISCDFVKIVEREVEECTVKKQKKVDFSRLELRSNKLVSHICSLSRLFNEPHGFALLTYIIDYTLYYSTNIDTAFNHKTIGETLYQLWFLITFSTIYGLGSHFAYQVRELYFIQDEFS